MTLRLYCPKHQSISSIRNIINVFIDVDPSDTMTVKEFMDGLHFIKSDRKEMIYKIHKWLGLGEIDCDCCK